jgi:hypothetical protein
MDEITSFTVEEEEFLLFSLRNKIFLCRASFQMQHKYVYGFSLEDCLDPPSVYLSEEEDFNTSTFLDKYVIEYKKYCSLYKKAANKFIKLQSIL